MARLAPRREWCLHWEGGLLVAAAGADHVFALEGLARPEADELIAAWESGSLDPGSLSPGAAQIAEELCAAGLTESGGSSRPVRVGVHVVGRRFEELAAEFERQLEESARLELAGEAPELVLFLRTTGRLLELYDRPSLPAVPHLLLDVAYHHTISLGPLVVGGQTACLACLAGRINHLWGDPRPPERPAAIGRPALIAALAVAELERAAAGDFALANCTVSYDLDEHRVVRSRVYKLPWCPVCGDQAGDGRLDLPWAAAA